MLQVEARTIERRELLLCAIGPPGKRALLRIDVRVGQPGLGRRHQAIGHQGAMVAGELPDDPRLPARLSQGSLNNSGRNPPDAAGTARRPGSASRPTGWPPGSGGSAKFPVRSASRSLSAMAQLLVPRSMPRLKRAGMEAGVLMICGPEDGPGRAAAKKGFHFTSTSAGAMAGNGSAAPRSNCGSFTISVFQPRSVSRRRTVQTLRSCRPADTRRLNTRPEPAPSIPLAQYGRD